MVAVALGLVIWPGSAGAGSQESAEDAPAPDPYSLVPVERVVEVAARRQGETAADTIRNRVREAAETRIEAARTGSAEAQQRVAELRARLEGAAAAVQTSGTEIDAIQFEHREVVHQHREAAVMLEDRMAVLYAQGPSHATGALGDGFNFVEAASRNILLDAILDADRDRLLDTYLAATADVTDVAALSDDLRSEVALRESLVAQRRDAIQLSESETAALIEVERLRSDLAFPVVGDYSFVDTFLAARMAGTSDVHRHQGIDIFAPEGTPLVAVERGIVVKIGEVRLGGLRLWLIGESGTHYYYAHLSGFADLTEGQFVETGHVLGYVGNTGNARTTPPHVHFQVHPDGGGAVNGFPLLDALRARDAELSAAGDIAYGLCPRSGSELHELCQRRSDPAS